MARKPPEMNQPTTDIYQPAGWNAMLAAEPLRNSAARVDRLNPRQVRVTVRRERPWFLKIPVISWLVPFHDRTTFELDALGVKVYDLCDGSHDVLEIVELCENIFSLTFHEARVLVSHYLRQLVQRGIIAIAIPDSAAASSTLDHATAS